MNEAEHVDFLSGRFEPDDEQTWHHVPFDVPADVRQMRIQVAYAGQIPSDPMVRGGNVLDIGVFDARGTASGGPGFRGWSGSDKLDLVIGEAWSTPPYVAGPLPPGTWHLLLGPYKVGPNGLDWQARITFDPEPEIPNQAIPPTVGLPTRRNLPHRLPGWYCGDLHNHSVFSDGSGWPVEVAARAAAEGLDFFGITDHNRAQSPHPFVPHGDGWPVLVPGVEVTTYAGHFNVWGTDRWYDFREPDAAGLQRAIDTAIADGGFVSMNHPKPFGPEWEYPELTGFHGIEAWNGWWARLNVASTRVWEASLADGRSTTPLAGSDMHLVRATAEPDNPFAPAVIGYPTLWVRLEGELTAEAVIAALHRGDVSISDAPDGPQIAIDGPNVRVVRGRGLALVTVAAGRITDARAISENDELFEIHWPPDAGMIRFEIHGALGTVRALSNAIRRM